MNYQFLRAQTELHAMWKQGMITANELWNQSVILSHFFHR